MKKSILVLFFSGLISASFLMVYYLENNAVKKVTNDIAINEKKDIMGNIESINESEGKLLIDGWALEKNKTHEYYNWVSGKGEDVYINNRIVLIDENDNTFEVKTVAVESEEANTQANDGINHKKCGVKAAVKLSKLEKGTTYTAGIILTNIDGEETLIKSDKEIRI